MNATSGTRRLLARARLLVPVLGSLFVAIAWFEVPSGRTVEAQRGEAEPARCPRCGLAAPATRRVVQVRNVDQLQRAAREAAENTTILLDNGVYELPRMIDLAARGTVLRSRGGDPRNVILHGGGMRETAVGVALSVSAADVTIADVTIRDVGFHAVQVRGERGASGFTLHNARLLDTGQQLVKVSTGPGPLYADRGTVACSRLEYTDHAPSTYTNGITLLAGAAWVVRDNQFVRIRGPRDSGWSGGPAVLAWGGAEDTVVERNAVVDSFRGIALGLVATPGDLSRNRSVDHVRGVIRNNVILNLNSWADEAIEANGARDVRIEHNTVLVEGAVPWSIGVRFPNATAVVRNNLTTRQILLREGGRAETGGNISGARPDWFLDPPGLDFRLGPMGASAVDAGVLIPDVATDYARRPRASGRAPDAGAFESQQ